MLPDGGEGQAATASNCRQAAGGAGSPGGSNSTVTAPRYHRPMAADAADLR